MSQPHLWAWSSWSPAKSYHGIRSSNPERWPELKKNMEWIGITRDLLIQICGIFNNQWWDPCPYAKTIVINHKMSLNHGNWCLLWIYVTTLSQVSQALSGTLDEFHSSPHGASLQSAVASHVIFRLTWRVAHNASYTTRGTTCQNVTCSTPGGGLTEPRVVEDDLPQPSLLGSFGLPCYSSSMNFATESSWRIPSLFSGETLR